MHRTRILLLSLCALACSAAAPAKPPAGDGGGGAPVRKTADITLFFTAELKGTLEPCGCNSEPLGDIARSAELIHAVAKERPIALFDGGSTLFTDLTLKPAERAQADLKADLVAQLLPTLGLAGAGLGAYDLATGPDGVRFPRLAANLPAGKMIAAPHVVDVGGVKVGVFGVADPAAVPGATDPAAAARAAIAGLRSDGAQVIVALSGMRRADAKQLARDAPGADFVLVSQEVGDKPLTTADKVGSSYLISPADRGQVLARVDLHVDAAGGPLVDAVGPDRAAVEGTQLDASIAKLQQDIATWQKDPHADPAFVKTKQDDLAAQQKTRADLAANPLRAPAKGSWFVLRMVPIKRALSCEVDVVQRKLALDKAIGEANLKSSAAETIPAPAAGKAGFVGVEECASCHKAAVDFWRTTRHAHAWATLTDVSKQLDRDCVGCHVTGWLEPGGSTLAVNEPLRDVQCEVCHGPGSIHVDANGHDKPRTVGAPADNLCASRCHTPEHSDTFQHEAYLRDITGKGHGEKLRLTLGDGPTGHELRKAALDKANQGVGANCPR